ncbi:MAG: hypothetical protein K2O18_15085 [Oscillospiraceae bacterium]|nr:hypothetical protein [Oscillospiraceae bacterium]
MAVIGTFGSYTAARLGIYSAQSAMHVVGNNIGNINTEGYTRQRTDQSSMYDTGTPRYQNQFNINIGYGAIVDNVSQLRDPFLDIRFRNENASLGYYEAMQNGLEQISNILDEVGKGDEGFGVIEAQLGDFKNALDYLLEHPNSTTHDDLARGAASTLCTLLNSYAKELEQTKRSEEARLMENVDEVNFILENIRDLNEQIRTQSVYGGNALELRDARNVQIDKLSKFMNIDVTYSMERINQTTEVEKLTITLKNTDDYTWNGARQNNPITLVDGIYAAKMDFGPDENDRASIWGPSADDPNKSVPTEKYVFYDIGYDWFNEDNSKSPFNVPMIPANSHVNLQDLPADIQAKINGTEPIDRDSTKAVFEAEKYRVLNFGETLAINPEYDPMDKTPALKYLDKNGVPTDDIDKAAVITSYQKGADDNRYMFRISELTDKRGIIKDYDRPMYTSYPVWLDDNDTYGYLQGLREMLTEEGEYSSQLDIALDPNAAVKHGIPYFQHMLDSFAQKLASELNSANTMPNVEDYVKVYGLTGTLNMVTSTDKDGNTIQVPDPATTFADKSSAATPPAAIQTGTGFAAFSGTLPDGTAINITAGDISLKTLQDLRKVIDAAQDPDNPFPKDSEATPPALNDFEAYQTALKDYQICLNALRDNGTLTEEYRFYDGGMLFSNNGELDDPSNINAKNISVSYSWAHGMNRILNSVKPNETYIDADDGSVKWQDGTTRNDNIAHFVSLMGQTKKYNAKDTVHDAVYNNTEFFKGNFQEMYGNVTSTLGTDSRTANVMYSTYNLTTLNLDNDRISVYGVDLNEEATNMMQFSQAFSAACKLLTTIDEMLDTLINRTI